MEEALVAERTALVEADLADSADGDDDLHQLQASLAEGKPPTVIVTDAFKPRVREPE